MTSLQVEIEEILRRCGIAAFVVEAARILAAVSSLPDEQRRGTARDMAARRAAGEPLAYVTGREPFMGLELIVDEGALVPRAETALLGNTALDAIRGFGVAKPLVIDMCCGSGNLACAIAHHLPDARVWASDLTASSVALARRNAHHTGVSDRVVVVQGDLFDSLRERGLEDAIDAVVCNPPYISSAKLDGPSANLLRHEPREAFDGGPYGISIKQRIVKDALSFLRTGGVLLLEFGLGQERQVERLFSRAGGYGQVEFHANADGAPRAVSGRKVAAKSRDQGQ